VKSRPAKLARVLLLVGMLLSAWLLWSGLFNSQLLALGVFSCLLTVYLTRRMGFFDDDVFALGFGWRLVSFWGWLAKEIVLSSIEVARIIIDPRLPISPEIIEIKATASHPVDQAILANSITLTPGTLALDVHRGVITVHSLTQSGANDLLSGEMDRRVAALRGD